MHRPPAISPRSARRRLGLTLIEAALVLGVVALVFGGLSQILGEASETVRAKNVAERMKEIANASERYISARVGDIRKLGPGAKFWLAVEGADETQPGFPGLIQAGYLPPSYRDYDAYNQHHIVFVRVLAPAAGTTQNRIEAMVSTLPMISSGVLPLRLRGRIASMIGAQGGFCQGAAPGTDTCDVIKGVGGGWATTAAEWNFIPTYPVVRGSVQAIVNTGDSAILSDYLNRNDVGSKAANTMNTTIYSAVQSGAYAMEADPANGQTTLRLGPSVTVGGCNDTGAAGDLVACNDAVANRFVDRQMPSFYLDPGMKSELNLVRTKKLDITDTVVFTTDADSRLQNNEQIRLRDLLPRYVAQDGFKVEYDEERGINETQVVIPDCAKGGGTPRIFLAPMQDSFSYNLADAIKYKDYEDYLVSMGGPGSTTSKPALTNVQCANGGCTTESEGFLSDTLVGTRKAISTMSIGSMQLYRQYAAAAPSGLVAGAFWNVSFSGSPFAVQANSRPVPWRALATTYCYY
jgi:hypothetical protein